MVSPQSTSECTTKGLELDNQSYTENWRLQIVSALKVFYYYLANSEKDLMFGILHPGDGQYYCLSIIDDNQVLLYMNRDASATTFHPSHYVLEDFGRKAKANPEKVASSLYSGSEMEYSYGSINARRAAKLRMVAHIIGLLGELTGNKVDLRWGYSDSSDEGAVSNFNSFPSAFPLSWSEVLPVNSKNYDWAGNILQVTAEGMVVATYNQQTAELLLPNGRVTKF